MNDPNTTTTTPPPPLPSGSASAPGTGTSAAAAPAPGPTPPLKVSLGQGLNSPHARRRELLAADPVGSLATLLGSHTGREAWWCASIFGDQDDVDEKTGQPRCPGCPGDHRRKEGWEGSVALPMDLDYQDQRGKHAAPPEDMALRLLDAVRAGEIPASLYHATPRGGRPVPVLDRPTSDPKEWDAAAAGACALTAAALARLDLAPRPGRGGFKVDGASRDRARLLYTPRATVRGVERDAEVEVVRGPYTIAELASHAPPEAPKPPPSSQGKTGTTAGAGARLSGATPYGAAALKAEIARVAGATEGERNSTLFQAAANVIELENGGQLPSGTAEAELVTAAVSAGLTGKEAQRTVKSARKRVGGKARTPPAPNAATARPPWRRALEDTGNAQRLLSLRADDLRYCGAWKKWLVWDGTRWHVDETGLALHATKEVKRTIRAEAKAEKSKKRRRDLLSWARASGMAERRRAMLALAACDPRVTVTVEQLDADPALLTALNGTVDLRMGTLRPHRRGDLITKLAPVRFVPGAPCPRWRRFLTEIFASDQALVKYQQRALGYAATGEVREHVLHFLHGDGANGKSTEIEVVLAVLGEYATAAPRDLLILRTSDAHPTEFADLFGRRLVVATETGEGRRWDEAKLKWLTGGDTLKGRRMREDFWEFTPTHKLWVLGNHKPEVRGIDDGVWRRLRLVPYAVKFWDRSDPDAPADGPFADPALKEALLAESEGILAWIVGGAVAWYAQGLAPIPPAVLVATAAYREESDHVGAFLAARCVLVPGIQTRKAEVRDAYESWCKAEGERPLGRNAFAPRLRRHGIKKGTRDSKGESWKGVALRTETQDESEAQGRSAGGPGAGALS